METPAAQKLRCIIVDDDLSSRIVLSKFVQSEPDLDLVQVFDNGMQALEYLTDHAETQLLFLDIQMPDLNGMELLRAMPERHPVRTILTTTEKSFAVDAYELGVVDYLVKPFEQSRFRAALDRVRKMVKAEAGLGHSNKEIFFKSSNRHIRVRTEEVNYVEALSDYVVLVMKSGQKHIIHSTMKAMDDKLSPLGFMRIHRSFIVNMAKVDSVADHHAKVGEKKLPISKSYQDVFYQNIKAQDGSE